MRHSPSTLVLAITGILLAACSTPPPVVSAMCDDPSDQPLIDTALASAIRESLQLENAPTCADLATLQVVSARNSGVVTLSGLEHAPTVTFIDLQDNAALADLAPLSELQHLETLLIDRTGVADLTPLATSPSLTHLVANGSLVTDLAPLAGVSSLRSVYVSDTSVSSLAPLAGLSNLTAMGAARTSITDLSPLAGLPLSYMWVSGNPDVAGLDVLATLPTLQQLLIGDTGFADADMPLLMSLPNLIRLQLWGNGGITDIGALADLPLTTELDLGGTNVTDLTAIAAKTTMQRLALWRIGLQKADVAFLETFTDLEYLDLRGNAIDDIGFLAANTHLGSNSTVILAENPLDLDDVTVEQDLATLVDRGVSVVLD